MCEKALQVAENQTLNMADNAAVMKNLVAVVFACWDLATAVTHNFARSRALVPALCRHVNQTVLRKRHSNRQCS
jgi:hypothetical protein